MLSALDRYLQEMDTQRCKFLRKTHNTHFLMIESDPTKIPVSRSVIPYPSWLHRDLGLPSRDNDCRRDILVMIAGSRKSGLRPKLMVSQSITYTTAERFGIKVNVWL